MDPDKLQKVRLLASVIEAIDFALAAEAWLPVEQTKLENTQTKLQNMINKIENRQE